ncbi:unnamed protein product [Rotaria sordida]|uniref:Uncharacterized protein n=1 Tax=Rotaria sordida TaxID=392033 RepID=A0A818KJV3_9BILA|nr:unnamed protein product [Rotaria sordida]
MDKSILVASDTKSRASTRITRVSRRLQSREKQVATTTVTDSMTVTTTMDNTTQTTTTTATAGATICSTTAITTTITTTPLPPQCSNYTSDTSATRNAAYTVLGNACDTFSPSPKWFRFSGGAGTMVANCPVHFSNCNTNMAGWYSGVYPSIAELASVLKYFPQLKNVSLATCEFPNDIQFYNGLN